MISKSILLGVAAAVIATGTGFYIAMGGSTSTCDNGCPIRAMFNSKSAPSQEAAKEESGGCCGISSVKSCCDSEVSKNSKLVNAKPSPVDSQSLAACVGASAYATHPQPVLCCADE